VIQSFIAHGMYVVLDYQPMNLEQQAYDADVFISTWAGLWKQVGWRRSNLARHRAWQQWLCGGPFVVAVVWVKQGCLAWA
jgi:hypothetical protein